MRKLLITGGAGFIGSNFVRMVLSEYPDCFTVNLDKLTYAGNLENLDEFLEHKNHKFIKGDICDGALVEKIIDQYKIDTIINFAAESHVDRSITEPKVFIQTNVTGTLTLLEKYNITRCSNNYGPYQFPEKLIPLMINNALNNKELPIYGDGLYIRDWIYVYDHCTAIWNVLADATPGEIYNISACNERTNLEVVDLILNRLRKPKSLIKHVTDRPGHDRRYATDSKKIMTALNWQPSVGFQEGINKTIDWYLQNQEWLAKVVSGDYQKYYDSMYSNR
ncbi:MAG: dTDP-glucose 4,6-dehydratase [Planctomycetota bacterium]|jgi:dTDP-glucose 4,6-dehydratase